MTPPTLPSENRHAWFWLGLLLAITSLFYTLSLSIHPGPTGDNAEFQYLGRALGVSHPTGYPLYLLLTHFFQAIVPGPTLAWKINFFSMLCGLGALTCVCGIALRLRLSPWAILPATAWLATTPTWWRLSTVAEVYALHSLFLFGTLWLFLIWTQTRKTTWLLAGILLHALAYGNHLTSLLLLPSLLLIIASRNPALFRSKKIWGWTFFSVLLGASTYLYVWIRASAAPDMATYTRFQTLGDFFAYITGTQYHGQLDFTSKVFPSIQSTIQLLVYEWHWIGLLAVATGALLAIHWRGFWLALLLMGLLQILIITFYRISDIEDYFMPMSGLGALLIAATLHTLTQPLAQLPKFKPASLPLAAALSSYFFIFSLRGYSEEENNLSAILRAEEMKTFFSSIEESTYLLCPDWTHASLARYYLFTLQESPSVRVTGWTKGEIEALSVEERRAWLEHKLSLFHRVILISSSDSSLLDTRAPIQNAGFRLESISDSFYRIAH